MFQARYRHALYWQQIIAPFKNKQIASTQLSNSKTDSKKLEISASDNDTIYAKYVHLLCVLKKESHQTHSRQ